MTVELFSSYRDKEISRTGPSRIVGNASDVAVHRSIDRYSPYPSNEICQLHDNSTNHGWTGTAPLFFGQGQRAEAESLRWAEDRDNVPFSPPSSRIWGPPPCPRTLHPVSRTGRPTRPAT